MSGNVRSAPDGAPPRGVGLMIFDRALGVYRPVRDDDIEALAGAPAAAAGGEIAGGGTVAPTAGTWRRFRFYNAGSAPVAVRVSSGAGSAPEVSYGGGAEEEIDGRILSVSFSSAPITWRAS